MNLSLNQFIKYKIHIGHSYKTVKFLSSWLLYRIQGNLWIMNIFKTILFIKNIIIFIKYLINNSLPIWFVNLEMTKESIFLMYSKICGEFACTRYWVRGILSNYLSVSKSIRKYASKKCVYKSSVFLKIINNWYITRYTWPRSIFISNIDNNYIVCKEASLMLIPIISIIDSNSRSFLVKLPIISNDDSMESFYYILNIISKLILLFKYKKLILWFSNYKKKIKEINIKNLINNFYFIKKYDINYKIILFKPISLFKILNKNLNKIKINRFFTNLNINNINLVNMNSKILKRRKFYKKFVLTTLYKKRKSLSAFRSRFSLSVSKYANRYLFSLKRKRQPKYFRIFYRYLKKKYSSFFFSSLIYSIKYSRIFYNSFFFKKLNKFSFLNLNYLYKLPSIKMQKILPSPLDFISNKDEIQQPINVKYGFFPFFLLKKKKKRFIKNYKNIKKQIFNFLILSNKFKFKLPLNYYKNSSIKPSFLKLFIELYYNKWAICLLN